MYGSPVLLLIAGSVLLTACAPQVGRDLPPYGESVRHMLQAQTYQPGEGEAPPPTLQGDRAKQTMDAYRAAGVPAATAPAPMAR